MFTLSLNSEIRNVIGLIAPCHRPSQNPAGLGVLICATVFGPGAQAARRRTLAATNAMNVIRDFDISTSVQGTSQHGFASRSQAFRLPRVSRPASSGDLWPFGALAQPGNADSYASRSSMSRFHRKDH